MKTEVVCACEFFARILTSRQLPVQFIGPFSSKLEELLTVRYKDHWHPENPRKGSAYRCIRINGTMDPVIMEAAKATGLSNFPHYLPKEFTMWIDPNEVSYRFGEDGSISQCPMGRKQEERYSYSSSPVASRTRYSSSSPEWRSPSNSPPPQHTSERYLEMYAPSLSPALSLGYKAPISVHV